MNQFVSSVRHAQDYIFKGVIALTFVAAILYIFPREGKFKYEFEQGKPWLHEDLIAPFDFAIYKSEATLEEERDLTVRNNKPYFHIANVKEDKLNKFIGSFDRIWEKHVENDRFDRFNQKLYKQIQETSTPDLLKKRYLEQGEKILNEIYAKGIIQLDDVIADRDKDFDIVVVDDENVAEDRALRSMLTIKEAHLLVENRLAAPSTLLPSVIENLIQEILVQNITYNFELTDKVLTDKLSKISDTRDGITKGEKVIGKGDMVSELMLQRINSMQREHEKFIGGSSDFYAIFIGQLILIGILTAVLIAFMALFRKEIILENDKFIFILLLITLMVYMTSISSSLADINVYALPLCILPIITRSFFDVRTATFVHIITTILIGFIVPNGFEYVFVQSVTGLVAIFVLNSLERRSQLFATTFFIFIVYTITYLGFSLIHEGKFEEIEYMNLTWFAANALLTLLAYPVMYVFEKAFNFLSDVTLIELSNTNSPVLRELAEKVPGTFQHSLQVANLAESAIQQVGGNPLLVRTGALYHDIGKIKNPAFFIENQHGMNPHDEIPYKDSAKIIIDHVIHGIELAKKHGLPEQIIDFIRTHHGTSTTGYFYSMYKKDNPDEEVDIADFQYPGPIPFSKETAILMMADACEAASRSLKEHTHESISSLVEGIINHQASQDQFVNADITFRDIKNIKKVFTQKLINIHHVRIEYPK